MIFLQFENDDSRYRLCIFSFSELLGSVGWCLSLILRRSCYLKYFFVLLFFARSYILNTSHAFHHYPEKFEYFVLIFFLCTLAVEAKLDVGFLLCCVPCAVSAMLISVTVLTSNILFLFFLGIFLFTYITYVAHFCLCIVFIVILKLYPNKSKISTLL